MACLKPSELWKESDKMWNMWSKSKSIERWGLKDDLGAFKRMFESNTGKIFEAGEHITSLDIKKMQVGINDLNKSLGNPGILTNKFIKSFYVGSAKAMRNPYTQKFFNSLVNANEYRNSHTANMMGNFSNMVSKLKIGILEFDGIKGAELKVGSQEVTGNLQKRDVFKPSNIALKNQANAKIKKLDELESKYVAKLKNGEDVGTVNEMNHLFKYLEGEGAVFEDFMGLLTATDNTFLAKKYEGTRKDPKLSNYINTLTEAASSWKEIQVEAKGHLIKSIGNVQKTIELKYGKDSRVAKRLIEEYESTKQQLVEHKGGYVPHFILNLLGQSLELRDKMSVAKPEQVESIMQSYLSEMGSLNTRLSKRLAPKTGPDAPRNEYFTRNPLLYAEKYISQVVQFNHGSFIDMHYAENLHNITGTIFRNPGSKEAEAAKVYQNLLTDLYKKGNNLDRIEDGHADNITRLLTSLQFTAKLGFSTRGALRNWTQSLLNLSHFGGLMTMDASQAYKHEGYKTAMETELNNHGLKFMDISQVTEGAVSNADLLARGINFDKGYLTKKESSDVLETMTAAGVKLADASSKLTKIAENKNRKLTFKIGFHKRVEQLKQLKDFADWGDNPAVKDKMYRQAGNYAAKVTSLLHFEYARFGKADILNHPLGSILGQFGHYGMSYANWNTQLLKDYKRAYKAGDYRGEELGRIVKLGMIHSITELTSAATGIDFTSYIQHDTMDRASNLVQFLTGSTPAEIATGDMKKGRKAKKAKLEAFHGKGLAGGLGLVPVADLVEIHNLGAAAGYWKMLADPGSTAAYLTGMRKYKRIDGKEFAGELAGMMSIQGERLLTRTGPAFTQRGNWMSNVLTAELGLYPGTTTLGVKTRDVRKKYLNKINPKKKSNFKRGALRYDVNRRLSNNQRRSALNSLDGLG